MPRTTLAAQTVSSAGISPTYEAANVDGYSLALVRGRLVHVKNTSAAAITVTVPTPQKVDALDVAERTYTVAATNGELMFSLGDGGPYRQTSGVAFIDFSAVASVTVAAFDVI